MFIKLYISSTGDTAGICAWAEKNESLWKGRYAVRIHHIDQVPAMTDCIVPLANDDDDLYVQFRGTVSFEQFCEEFSRSEYNDPNRYHLLNHNCANGAAAALQIAGIALPVDDIRFVSFTPGAWFKFPRFVLTPASVYQCAREYKQKELENLSNPIHSSMANSLASLGIWADKSTENQKKRTSINTIIEEVQKRMKARPYHVDAYLDLLKQLNALLDASAAATTKNTYGRLSRQFTERETSYRAWVIKNYIDLSVLICGSSVLKTMISICMSFHEESEAFLLVYSTLDLYLTLALIGLPIAIVVFDAVRNPRTHRHPGRSETPLSQALTDLNEACSSDSANGDSCQPR